MVSPRDMLENYLALFDLLYYTALTIEGAVEGESPMRFYQYPELEDLMESLSDEAILAVCENAMNKIKNLDANPPVEALL